jgi:hypothetical protein
VHFMKPRRNMIYLLGWSPATWEWAFVHRLSEFKHGFNVLSIELTQVFFFYYYYYLQPNYKFTVLFFIFP